MSRHQRRAHVRKDGTSVRAAMVRTAARSGVAADTGVAAEAAAGNAMAMFAAAAADERVEAEAFVEQFFEDSQREWELDIGSVIGGPESDYRRLDDFDLDLAKAFAGAVPADANPALAASVGRVEDAWDGYSRAWKQWADPPRSADEDDRTAPDIEDAADELHDAWETMWTGLRSELAEAAVATGRVTLDDDDWAIVDRSGDCDCRLQDFDCAENMLREHHGHAVSGSAGTAIPADTRRLQLLKDAAVLKELADEHFDDTRDPYGDNHDTVTAIAERLTQEAAYLADKSLFRQWAAGAVDYVVALADAHERSDDKEEALSEAADDVASTMLPEPALSRARADCWAARDEARKQQRDLAQALWEAACENMSPQAARTAPAAAQPRPS